MTKGFVSLVGAGPGDPDLLTVKALRLLKQAGVVVYDRLVSTEIMNLVPTGVSCISVGKSAGQHCLPQHEINKLLVSLAKSGRRVVRLKGGDPYLFGRGGEEALVLKQYDIPFEVVPGVTAAAGCSAYTGIPLTQRGMNHGVRFLTGHLHNDDELGIDWSKIADPDCTLVIYMGLGSLQRISDELVNAGLAASTPTAAVHNGTTMSQQKVISTLSDIPAAVERAGLKSPVIIIVGEVVSLSEELDWFQSGDNMQLLSEEDIEHNSFDLARA